MPSLVAEALDSYDRPDSITICVALSLRHTIGVSFGREYYACIADEQIPFDSVWTETQRVLLLYLRKMGASHEDANDIASMTCARVQSRLAEVRFETKGRWYAYCKITADNIRKKLLARDARFKIEALDESTVVVDEEFTDALDMELGTQRIRRAMNDMFLGPSQDRQNLRVLLATMVLVDGRPESEAIRALRKAGCQEATLSTFLGDPRTICETAYHMLRVNPRDLTATVLGIPETAFVDMVHAKNNSMPFGGWRYDQLEVALNRFCDYRPISDLISHVSNAKKSEILATVATLETQLPFSRCMHLFLQKCDEFQLCSGYVGTPGVWKRLAFEYKLDGLSSLDFVSWFGSPARLVKITLTASLVHSWTAGKRPVVKIRDFIKAQTGTNERP